MNYIFNYYYSAGMCSIVQIVCVVHFIMWNITVRSIGKMVKSVSLTKYLFDS